ncbi:hypothetical protein B7988_14005 [Fibrobacter sp. UWB1]|nr:hypothetical protein B7988_14005 [Fibrobacter sp. UWB1]
MGGGGAGAWGRLPLFLYKKDESRNFFDSRLTNNLKGRKASLMPQSEHRERAHTPKARSADLIPLTG